MIRLLILLTITASYIEAGRHYRNPNNAYRKPGNRYVNGPYLPKSNNRRYPPKYDPCGDFYCANGGKCTFNCTTPTCQCLGEWTGDRCDVSPCDGYKGCDPGFSCLVDTDSGMTKCCPKANPCDSVTCENGGECLIDYDSQTGKCCCAEGFTGDNCDIKIDACTINPCENYGICQVGEDDQAICICEPTFAGPTCAVDCYASVTCPSGLEKIVVSKIERCYFISTDIIESWAAAVKACSDQGLILWEPNTNNEVTAVAALLAGGNYWVGVSDVIQEGNVIFSSSGEPFTLTTDDTTVVKDCLEFIKDSMTFEFRACYTSTRRYVCEQQTDCV